jgi:hypothetical protein
MPPIDRHLLHRDLETLAGLLERGLISRLSALPFPLNLAYSPAVLTRELSAAFSRLEESPDEDLAPVIDALARELGVIRGALPQGASSLDNPEVPAALGRIVGRIL